MKRSIRGFTIVELLIVIVVIGILAAITIVAYNGVQKRAQNTANVANLRDWEKQFELYRANTGELPAMPTGSYCLGDVLTTNNKCGSYLLSGASTYAPDVTLTGLLASVGASSSGKVYPVNNSVGPYVDYPSSGLSVILYGVFHGNTGECPSGLEQSYADGAGRIHCRIKLVK